jgi:hypothetical protein
MRSMRALRVRSIPAFKELLPHARSGSGRRSAVEAIGNIYFSIAWLPPEYEPGAGDGVASAARQRGLFGLGTFWFDDTTSGSRRKVAIAA